MLRDQATTEGVAFLQEILFAGEDVTRFLGSLSKLTRHLQEPPVVTGSLACGWHLLRRGKSGRKRRLNDIDIVVEGLPSLRPSLAQDFLIAHFHPSREKGKILIQLVDEEHGTRVDVFTPGARSLTKRLTGLTVGGVECRLVSAEDLLAKLLSIMFSATRGEPVERKYVEQFHLLSTAADLNGVREVWREYRKESQPLDFEEAAGAVERSIKADSGLLEAGHYSQDVQRACAWCCESELFPLAARSRVYGILGYV